MKRKLAAAVLSFAAVISLGLEALACNPASCGGRPGATVPVRPNPGTAAPTNPGINVAQAGGNQVVWDLPQDEKARIRAAARKTSTKSANGTAPGTGRR
jgi:hypothetical protein